ncbi:MAG: sensor histidine kinase [Chthoniobacterales bacterium]
MNTPLAALADFLNERRMDITAEWLDRVRKDRKIPSADEMPQAELLDHLPELLEDLIKKLHEARLEAPVALDKGKVHGEVRWRQGYRLDELLREICVLRKVLMEYLAEFYRQQKMEQTLQTLSGKIVHEGLDDIVSKSTVAFVQHQEKEIQKANNSLQELNAQIKSFNDLLVLRDEKRLRTLHTITHEIANHLNVIGLISSVLKKNTDGEAIHGHLDSLSQNVSAMTGLMKHLLEFAALAADGEPAHLAELEPKSLFEELTAYAQKLTESKGLTLTSHFDSGLKSVISDQDKLYRICLNLITNAVKYTDKGEIHVSFHSQDEKSWKIEVRDTGVGIAQEEQKKIFEEFYRSASHRTSHPGVGLGLAITEHLTELLGGKIELKSKVGEGSTFCVILPRESLENKKNNP